MTTDVPKLEPRHFNMNKCVLKLGDGIRPALRFYDVVGPIDHARGGVIHATVGYASASDAARDMLAWLDYRKALGAR